MSSAASLAHAQSKGNNVLGVHMWIDMGAVPTVGAASVNDILRNSHLVRDLIVNVEIAIVSRNSQDNVIGMT